MALPPLIAIMTWTPDVHNGRNDAVRETWVREWCATKVPQFVEKPHYCFYYDKEHNEPLQWDELQFDVPRGLLNTSYKTQCMVKWALERGYEHVFFIPVDCYVCVPRLLVSGFEVEHYTGFKAYDEPHIGGGSGYWLSKRAMEAVAQFGVYPDYEDRWVGAAVSSGGMALKHDARYWSWEQPWLKGIITAHLSDPQTASYDPSFMRAYHKQYMERHEIWTIPPIQEC